MLSEGVTQNVRMFGKVFSRGVASDGGGAHLCRLGKVARFLLVFT